MCCYKEHNIKALSINPCGLPSFVVIKTLVKLYIDKNLVCNFSSDFKNEFSWHEFFASGYVE